MSVILVVVCFLTSVLTAISGMGGGVLLLSILPLIIPANAIIPIHGIVQLASNASRFWFGIKYAIITPILFFSVGAALGSFTGYWFIDRISKDLIPLFISFFILLIIWLPMQKIIRKIPGKYFTLGIVQSALSLYVGATGPISTSILIIEGYRSNQVIATSAGINTILNLFKSMVFLVAGFLFHQYILVLIFMCAFSIAGSYLGIKLRQYIKESIAQIILKITITVFCLINLVIYCIENFIIILNS